MNTINKSGIYWIRFVQVNGIILLCVLAGTGICALRTLQAEGAKDPAMMLAGGLLFIALELWAIFFLLFMAVLASQRRQPNNTP
jgi:hypothetical protein